MVPTEHDEYIAQSTVTPFARRSFFASCISCDGEQCKVALWANNDIEIANIFDVHASILYTLLGNL